MYIWVVIVDDIKSAAGTDKGDVPDPAVRAVRIYAECGGPGSGQ